MLIWGMTDYAVFWQKKILWCQIDFLIISNFFVLTIFRSGAKEDSALENPCQSWTKMEESRLWGSYLGCVHCKSHNLLQPSLSYTLSKWADFTNCTWIHYFSFPPYSMGHKVSTFCYENDKSKRSKGYLYVLFCVNATFSLPPKISRLNSVHW